MKMQIDFYSEDELSIHVNTSENYFDQNNETKELLLFSSYTLRQFYNLDQHLVAKALSGLLVYEIGLNNLLVDTPVLPTGEVLLESIKFYVASKFSLLDDFEKYMEIQDKLYDELNYNKTFMQSLNIEFLSKLPNLVNNRRSGIKSFEVTLPPLILKMKGFGILGPVLGYKITYYALHSVIGLYRYLGKKHKGDEKYLTNLKKIAMYCGAAHIFKQITKDQMTLARAFIDEI